MTELRWLQLSAIHGQMKQLKLNTPQSQRLSTALGNQIHPGLDQNEAVLDIHIQLDGGELESPGGVIRQTDRGSSSHTGSNRQLTRS